MSIIRMAVNLFEDLILLVNTATLIYLNAAGAWSDPNVVVLYAEVVLLWMLIFFALARAVKHIKEH